MTATFHVGDAIEVMGKLPENSVDLVLTSPPFLALRSYLPADHPDKPLEGGSQSTPGEYIDWLIDVVEACDRVLAPHGSLCVELGDTYAGSGGAGGDYNAGGWREGQEGYRQVGRVEGRIYDPKHGNAGIWNMNGKVQGGGTGWPLAKSLSLIPELFRLTLVYGHNPLTGRQTDRWRLRNVIRWVRPNPPVGALGDKFRPATSELMVFCKSARRYFDLDAVRESSKTGDRVMWQSEAADGSTDPGNTKRRRGEFQANNPSGAPPLDWWNIPLLEGEEETRYGPKERPTGGGPAGKKAAGVGTGRTQADADRWHEGLSVRTENPLGSPPLDWWNIPPGGYEGGHYAVWPPELLIKPVKAMCPERVCRVCGEPSRRIVDISYTPHGDPERQNAEMYARATMGQNPSAQAMPLGRATKNVETLGFSDCGHADYRAGLVLDPFGGSGTTALVATGHGRDCILIDLDERNYDLALQRVGPFMLERAG